MNTYKIGKTFANLAECDAWEAENCKDRKYNGECILMIQHTEDHGTVTLDTIITIG